MKVGNNTTRPAEIVKAVFEYKARHSDELDLKPGIEIQVLSRDVGVSGDNGWWLGRLSDCETGQQQVGLFPANYVQSDLDATLANMEKVQQKNIASLSLPQNMTISFDDLTLLETIGSGGFGKVHKALWNDKTVAVKIAHVDSTGSMAVQRERVEREARLFYSLNHANIVQLLAICLKEVDSPLGLVLEYCAGDALCVLLHERSLGLSAHILVSWAVQIARGMHYLHEEAPVPLVHRDLKSSNVLVKEDRRSVDFSFHKACLKITDFGLAREVSKSASRASVCGGTYGWMAPEVIKCSIYSKASDVWSFGVLVWELLTGEVPYKDISAMAVAYGIAIHELRLPVPSTCPPFFADLMQSCWSIEPHKRPTFGQILDDLENFAATTDCPEDHLFHSMQHDWREEIRLLFKEIKTLENDLRVKEEDIRSRLAATDMKEELLRIRQVELENREMELVRRELRLLLLNQPEEPPRRYFKSKFALKLASQQISPPMEFRSLISVKRVQPGQATSHSAMTSPNASPSGGLRILSSKPPLIEEDRLISGNLSFYDLNQQQNHNKPHASPALSKKQHSRLNVRVNNCCSSSQAENVFHRSTPNLHAVMDDFSSGKGNDKISMTKPDYTTWTRHRLSNVTSKITDVLQAMTSVLTAVPLAGRSTKRINFSGEVDQKSNNTDLTLMSDENELLLDRCSTARDLEACKLSGFKKRESARADNDNSFLVNGTSIRSPRSTILHGTATKCNWGQKPIPTERYKSYVRTKLRARSCDKPICFAKNGELGSISNPNYERHILSGDKNKLCSSVARRTRTKKSSTALKLDHDKLSYAGWSSLATCQPLPHNISTSLVLASSTQQDQHV